MEKTFIFGHKNPDTDSITSSIVMANLQTKLGDNSIIACSLGNPNKETSYALKYFEFSAPEVLSNLEPNSNVILVDHNEFSQSANGIENANIKMVVDHHRIANFQTSEPLFYVSEPVGCTATILYKMYKCNDIEIEPKIAGLMLSAIISDTLLFNSPTCTEYDKSTAYKLANIAGVDINTYGLNMLKAGTDLSDYSVEQLLSIDAKEFDMNGNKVEIAQVNTADINSVMKNKDNLENGINKIISDRNLDLFVFAITDILNNNSQIIALGNRVDLVSKSYNLDNNTAFLPGVVSRKKQIAPFISKNAEN